MKTKLFPAIAVAALLVSSVSEAKDGPNIIVTRTINGTRDGQAGYWKMDVGAKTVFFSCNGSTQILMLVGADKARSVLDTFSRWAAAAKANHVEPFQKAIDYDCFFNFANGRSTLNYAFTEADVERFAELMKQYPDAKREYDERLAKANKEAGLFN